MEPGLVLHTLFPLYAFAVVTMRLQLNTKRLHFRKRYLANIYLTHTNVWHSLDILPGCGTIEVESIT